ncbi:MAG: arginine--tRNA ligase [Candidatus Kerfeldbacteria bacterium]|nr:arginine--tRNA ligase [Candidatus Kerfeldbacteria bacterium]
MILPEQHLRRLLEKAIAKAYPSIGPVEIPVEPTSEATFGDFTSTVALKIAKQLGQQPRDVATHLVAQLGILAPILEKADIAGPGFINFTLKPAWIMKQVAGILADQHYGENQSGKAQRVVVEFISANPTGPMTLGNGRGAFGGDTLANVLTLNGWKVWREFYLNDIGNQVNILAESVLRRYWQQQGIKTEYPDYCYQGEYVTELAKHLKLHMYKVQNVAVLRDRIKGRVLGMMITAMQRVVQKKLRITFNTWFRESSLYEKKLDVKTLDVLHNHDLLQVKDGATWFRTTAFGDDKDRVLIKSDGEKTYFLSDIALRWNRFVQRKFSREILFLGADHHGYIRRLNAAVAALGFANKLDVQIVQLVRLIKGGQEVKMSKRAGTYVTLEEVVDEVGLDVARFFFLMHSNSTHMDFDLDLAKERSEKNPVYYVQYAFTRLSSIQKKLKGLPIVKSSEAPHTSELNLVKALLKFPGLIEQVGRNIETHKLPFYAQELATRFHEFYTNCRVIDDGKVWQHRLALLQATNTVLKKTLQTIGVSQPETM